jgi:hypothetical protein
LLHKRINSINGTLRGALLWSHLQERNGRGFSHLFCLLSFLLTCIFIYDRDEYDFSGDDEELIEPLVNGAAAAKAVPSEVYKTGRTASNILFQYGIHLRRNQVQCNSQWITMKF